MLQLLPMGVCLHLAAAAAAAAAGDSGVAGADATAVSRGSSSPFSIQLRASISRFRVSLTCEVSSLAPGAAEHKVQFFCPAMGDSKCFDDCTPMCAMREDSKCVVSNTKLLPRFVNCSIQKPPTKKLVQMNFDIRERELAGGWFCQYMGTRSCSVDLQHVPAPPTVPPTEPPTTTAAAVTTARHDPTTTSPADANSSSSGSASTGQDNSNRRPRAWNPAELGYDPYLVRFARADYVISLLAVLAASLVINVGFCIRCILARHYVNLRRRKQEPPGCLAHCLCVSTVQVVEKEDTYEEVGPKVARGSQQRASVRTMETTYIEHAGCLPRSRTMPPLAQPQRSLYYLQGVSDSMSRILYDDVPLQESRPASRQGSRPASPAGQQQQLQQLSGRHSRSRGSLRGLHKLNTVPQAPVPVVPEEVPFISEAGDRLQGEEPQQQQQEQQQEQQQQQQEDEDANSDYSGTTRLELSRMMLRKADTLLREANSLLRDTAHQPEILDCSD